MNRRTKSCDNSFHHKLESKTLCNCTHIKELIFYFVLQKSYDVSGRGEEKSNFLQRLIQIRGFLNALNQDLETIATEGNSPNCKYKNTFLAVKFNSKLLLGQERHQES